MNALTAPPKPFAWSYSRLKAFEDCPKRYYETQVLKNKWPEQRSEQLEWGDAVHLALAKTLREKTPLPTVFKLCNKWVAKVEDTPGEMLIEDDCRWAVSRALQPVPWFAKNVWLRCIADVVKLDPPLATVIDWKAGKSANVDPMQLTLTSLMLLLQFPDIHGVRSDFIWLQEDDFTTQMLYRNEAADKWAEIMPRVSRLAAAAMANRFPAKPNRFCKRYCVVADCEFHGK